MRTRGIASTDGAALVEVMIAVGLLVVFCAGTAQVITWTAVTMKAMRVETYAIVLAEDKVEELLAEAARGVTVEVSPLDALERDCAGFAEYLDDHGRPASEAPERGGVFLRRWSVRPLPGDETRRVLRVRVLDAAAAHAGTGSSRAAAHVTAVLPDPDR
ncbi:MAG: hypothetical protein LC753_18975 [Acidobacteria bacterium]|nr:hypothetical protein [Acidobacteriota bacterium]MCA1652248.1 hypothetical protein [Acidobacteriota bacterium]